ncbi:galactoside O-acetyltransferase [Staphylotrichum tortipilum]|uniref:Galactoside O-acetyltransferase n=1 Tax=Staphylotrichum tortipilum TaxID=2831512 RepID=A0AAN6MU52_9PEZI|nr:galactoside O-acetyltransferase [Staphylotrichum longicolle]
MVVPDTLDLVENRRRMRAGELYYTFASDLVAERERCMAACRAFNLLSTGGEASRRERVEAWKTMVGDTTPLPPPVPTPEEDTILLNDYPVVEGQVKFDYGYNCKFGPQVYINNACTFLDILPITIGARTLIGPNCAFYGATHPLDPTLRDGTSGPEAGKPITIGPDCWFGGSVVVLPGVTIGRGVTVGAGSVVTRDVGDFVVVAGNPARVIRRLEVVVEGRAAVTSPVASNSGPSMCYITTVQPL